MNNIIHLIIKIRNIKVFLLCSLKKLMKKKIKHIILLVILIIINIMLKIFNNKININSKIEFIISYIKMIKKFKRNKNILIL